MKTTSSAFANAFAENVLRPKAKVAVELGNNRFNDNQTVTSSSTKMASRGLDDSIISNEVNFWSEKEVFNNKNKETMRWLVCDTGATVNSTENGLGFRAIDLGDTQTEHGWWSDNTSDSSGIFSSPEWVQSLFDDREINHIGLYLNQNYPNMKQVTVEYRQASDDQWVTVAEDDTLGEDEYFKSYPLFVDVEINGLRIYVSSSYRANDNARIVELQGIFIKDLTDYVVSVDITETREDYESTVPIGTTSANTCSITFDNTDGIFNIYDTSSAISKYLAVDNKIDVLFGIEADSSQQLGGNIINTYGYAGQTYSSDLHSENNVYAYSGEYGLSGTVYGLPSSIYGNASPVYHFVPMGTFYSDEWSTESSSMTASVTCRDYSKFLQDNRVELGMAWKETTIVPVIHGLLNYAGISSNEITIDESIIRQYKALYIKDKTMWEFLAEVALADQGIFGFDFNNKFYYHSYNKLNTGDYTTPVFSFDEDINLESASVKTTLYANKVIAKVNQISFELGTRSIWSLNDTNILTYAKLGSNIDADDTTITVAQGDWQVSSSLDVNGWNKPSGYLWLPQISSGTVTGGEVIRYNNRSETQFLECERGYFNTTPASHTAGAYIGEVAYFDINFDNPPALTVKYPFITAIDSIPDFEDGQIQAYIILWENGSFVAKLAVGNTVPYKTWLRGSGDTYIDFLNTVNGTTVYEFDTVIAGVVMAEQEGALEAGREADLTVENQDAIRKYGKNEFILESPWIQSREHAQQLVDNIISEFRTPRRIINIEAIAYPALELGDRVSIDTLTSLNISDKDFHIIGINYAFNGAYQTSYTLREVKE